VQLLKVSLPCIGMYGWVVNATTPVGPDASITTLDSIDAKNVPIDHSGMGMIVLLCELSRGFVSFLLVRGFRIRATYYGVKIVLELRGCCDGRQWEITRR
jgi:hypothetical protein